MKFQYKNLGKNRLGQPVIRPIISIRIMNGSRGIKYEVLVDSGADVCIMDAEIAELIGIELTRGKKTTFMGATGAVEDCYKHNVEIVPGEWRYKTEIAFARNLNSGYGIVGQLGFF
jgi:hypothetical protein